MPGVLRTRVGYCGGTTANPTYDEIGDHLEAIQIDFDPEALSYRDLLAIFWTAHEPCRKPFARQYTSAIFLHDKAQRQAAQDSLEAEEQRRGEKVLTELAPLPKFYLAEDYHQKFYLQENRLLKEHFRRLYPAMRDFVNSTAAARINGYLGWYGRKRDFERAIDSLGLPPAEREELQRRATYLE